MSKKIRTESDNETPDNYDARFEMRLYKTFKNQVDEIAARENKTTSDWVREVISMKIKADKIKKKRRKNIRVINTCDLNESIFTCRCGAKYRIV